MMKSIPIAVFSLCALSSVATAQATFNYTRDTTSSLDHRLNADVPDNTGANTPSQSASFLESDSSTPTTQTDVAHTVTLGVSQPAQVDAYGVVSLPGLFQGSFSATVNSPLVSDIVGDSSSITLDLEKNNVFHRLQSSMWTAPGERFARHFNMSCSQTTEYLTQDVPFWIDQTGTATATLTQLSRAESGLFGASALYGSTSLAWSVAGDSTGVGVYDPALVVASDYNEIYGSDSISPPAIAFQLTPGYYVLRMTYKGNSGHTVTVSSPAPGTSKLTKSHVDLIDQVQFALTIN